MDRSAEFPRWKAQCLGKADLSRKGSVDEDVAELVQLLNGREQFFTTSSCSGRIILLDGSINGFEVHKQNCYWLLVTHKPCVKDDLIVALKKAHGDAVLKFEPLVLHVQCQQLRDAQLLHSVAIDSGFRNSGITVGKRGKTMLAVRSTHGLEVPLSRKGKLMVTEEYIDFLLEIANQKMEENKKRIERFYNCLQRALERDTVTGLHPKEKIIEKNHSCSRKKKRSREKTRGECVTKENYKELENDDDPGIGVTIFPEDYY
ncbi:tRNA wybutosine-synthesizing protein 3 homolog isoform X1 [Molossus molossus]|uniref:tRNA wybutosine-synthesizing protein 3 homolog n=1 Tax=Molossus molossus TaxID=27622 RepID=A0A7J8FD83_MOLMO|nr:tRNA wybutosine-synthesizing protein 3 homolog isoform X1 [Molossus molossus]KAF6445521.1 tRNA-yW synthesizing protein 3-like protein [Molossus molossus]